MLGTAIETIGTAKKVAYSVKEAAKETSLSPCYVRILIRDGDLKAKKAGRRLIILDADLREYLGKLEKVK